MHVESFESIMLNSFRRYPPLKYFNPAYVIPLREATLQGGGVSERECPVHFVLQLKFSDFNSKPTKSFLFLKY